MRTIYQFSGPIRMVEGRHGVFVYNKFCNVIGKSLEEYGEYCEHEMEVFNKLIRPTDVVWEIGANIGVQSVPISRICYLGGLIAFEPQVEIYKLLATNLALNNTQNARSLNMALGAANSILALPEVDYNRPSNFGGVELLENSTGKVKVEVRTVDSLDFLAPPNFMKIDAEGMELAILDGGSEVLGKFMPLLYLENDRYENSSALIEFLWSLGYTLYWHISPYFNDENIFSNPNNFFKDIYAFNMIGVPSNKKIEISGLPLVSDKNFHPLKK